MGKKTQLELDVYVPAKSIAFEYRVTPKKGDSNFLGKYKKIIRGAFKRIQRTKQ